MTAPIVPKLWPGSTIVCLASGPSLCLEDVEYVREKARVIAVNDTYRLAPWADVLYAADAKWWRHHQGVPSFTGPKYAIHRDARNSFGSLDVIVLRNTGQQGLETDPTGLRTGQNSGHQAINLAVHLGAKRILLLGYDMQDTNGQTHFFGNHPPGLQMRNPFALFRRYATTLVEPLQRLKIEIVNCSRETALTCFPRQDLRHALPALEAMAS